MKEADICPSAETKHVNLKFLLAYLVIVYKNVKYQLKETEVHSLVERLHQRKSQASVLHALAQSLWRLHPTICPVCEQSSNPIGILKNGFSHQRLTN